MKSFIIRNAAIVNEGKIFSSDVFVKDGLIQKIGTGISSPGAETIEASGKYLFPGIIDDQVHFREPGLTHKGDIASESRAAVAGGITSYMEMPNTIPNTLSQRLLEEKYSLAAGKSLANYSFFMGASNDNIGEVLKTNPRDVCGVKVFMGSSTGNMLVDDARVLENIFSRAPLLIATHCEDEQMIRSATEVYRKKYGEDVPVECHPFIRSAEACYKSSALAVSLAKQYNARLHVLHVSTAKELELFTNKIPLSEKKITAEACIHHLWFCDEDYREKGNMIKWNPAVKTKSDREALIAALNNDTLDIIATDHAPHTLEEKQGTYFKTPSGGPLVQHALPVMLELHRQKKITLEKIAEKMCHAPALCYHVEGRGFVREGYYADLVLVDMNRPWTVERKNILYKCGWSPFEGTEFSAAVTHTFVNGHLVYENGKFNEAAGGQRLRFKR